jgi:predicted nucleic acid-binding protein
MSAVFSDTSFFVAYLNSRDHSHELAHEYMTTFSEKIITTAWVLAELGNFLAEGWNRRLFVPMVHQFRADQRSRILPASSELFEEAVTLYGKRLDKDWSFVDCTSFITMKKERLNDALTEDHHFEQAGYRALLKVR